VVGPEKSLSRDELLEEMLWAINAIKDLAAQGGERRLRQDPQFRYAMAFLWLRLGEPANQLIRRRLVGDAMALRWQYLSAARNQLAHERNQDLGYLLLWRQIEASSEVTAVDVSTLLY